MGAPPATKQLSTGRFRVHVGLVLATVLCVPAFFFELSRALGGNTLSWAYVFEWPIFECFAIYMWWKLLHEDETPIPTDASTQEQVYDSKDQAKLDAWNAYLAELAESEGNDQS